MITINGVKYEGSNVNVINGRIEVNGRLVEENKAGQIIIEGDVKELVTDKSVTCNDVYGNVKAGGSVNCDDVKGNIDAGGSVNCDDVGGKIIAGGSINAG